MAQVFLVAALVGWGLMVGALWRMVAMLGSWCPTVANVTKSDYTANQQWEDRWLGNSMMTSRGFNWRDGEDTRLIGDEIVYTPADGRLRHGLVERWVWRGWQPSGVYTVWYDESDPDRVTARGPLHWFGLAIVGVMLLGISIQAIIRAGGVAVAIAQLNGHH